ncbi:13314_t:CDS:2 [Dentiscutata erythropus]|uniref:13314_t:CDS:1 n=1 Tax=Dentiscutata erythropus TaxID=1348616 RepID=A0A9N9EKY4_9GLOM|nr:13314_t:CDS:2 [Dentiscutata erythropus]
MPKTLVWCTCSICSLSKDGSLWKLKSARTRHHKRDRRNKRSPSDELELQNTIQNQATYGFYQGTFEPELNNLENDNEFGEGSRNNNRLENVNRLENGFEYANEFENGLDYNNEFEGINESENGSEIDEFEDWSENDSSDSSIASSTLTDNEEDTSFISSELATVIRLLKGNYESHNNKTN